MASTKPHSIRPKPTRPRPRLNNPAVYVYTRGVARNLFRRGTKEWVPSPVGYRALGGVSGKAPRKPKIILKISLNVKNFILFRGKISTWQFRRGTCPPGPLPYAPGV